MKKRICMFAAFMLALSLVLCGCGGFSDVGDGTSATGEAPTSRAEESSGAAVPDTTGDTSVAADTTTVETPPETPPRRPRNGCLNMTGGSALPASSPGIPL